MCGIVGCFHPGARDDALLAAGSVLHWAVELSTISSEAERSSGFMIWAFMHRSKRSDRSLGMNFERAVAAPREWFRG